MNIVPTILLNVSGNVDHGLQHRLQDEGEIHCIFFGPNRVGMLNDSKFTILTYDARIQQIIFYRIQSQPDPSHLKRPSIL